MANIRQSIILRQDLSLPKGLSEAQVAHLHFELFRKHLLKGIDEKTGRGETLFTPDVIGWLKTPYTFVHGVPNLEVLNYFYKIAKEKQIMSDNWEDTIYIQVSPTQKIVVENCLIGIVLLGESDKIKSVIGDLPLLS